MAVSLPRPRTTARLSYTLKFAAALALALLADWLFTFNRAGWTLGLYAVLLLGALALLRPAIGRRWAGLAALVLAFGYAATLMDTPSLLGAVLFWAALGFAALVPRAGDFDDAWRWALRLSLQNLSFIAGPLRDFALWLRARGRSRGVRVLRLVALLALPLVGGAIFVMLFALANPLIANAFAAIDEEFLFGLLSLPQMIVWAVAFTLCWAVLRPARFALRPARGPVDFDLPGVTLASVTLSLALFNAIFAIQNGLDIAFLWSGAVLPEGVTLADYAHRGAYPLIVTALLAGLFVLVTLRPGTDTAASAIVRRLVYLWIAQNVFLVASSMLRTIDYIEVYSLTRLRIAALIWMALVALGLVLICVRLWRRKSAAWLINANAAAALAVLSACAVIDLGTVAARWNLVHAREAGGKGTSLDLCYLNRLGPSALVPVTALEARLAAQSNSRPAFAGGAGGGSSSGEREEPPLTPPRNRGGESEDLRERVGWLRNLILDDLEPAQADWHGWTWRGARRLAETQRLIAVHKLPRVSADRRQCDGRPFPPPPPPAADPEAASAIEAAGNEALTAAVPE